MSAPYKQKFKAMSSRKERFLYNNKEIRIVMVGKTGAGKSASANTILGEEKFKAKRSLKSVTEECAKADGQVDGQKVSVIDTPGLFDTKIDEETTLKNIIQCLAYASPGPHVFLIVVRSDVRFTEEEKKAVQKIQKIFGKEADRYSMVLFTCGDQLGDEPFEEFLSESEELQELVDKCNGQYHVFDNTKVEDRSQVTDLLGKIRYITDKNGGSHYTTEMFQEAERAIEEEKKRILKAEEEQRRKEQMELEKELERKYEQKIKAAKDKLEKERKERAELEEKERQKAELLKQQLENERNLAELEKQKERQKAELLKQQLENERKCRDELEKEKERQKAELLKQQLENERKRLAEVEKEKERQRAELLQQQLEKERELRAELEKEKERQRAELLERQENEARRKAEESPSVLSRIGGFFKTASKVVVTVAAGAVAGAAVIASLPVTAPAALVAGAATGAAGVVGAGTAYLVKDL